MNTVLLHGFWGAPKDWTKVSMKLPLSAKIWIPDLYQRGALAPHHTIEEWVPHFMEELEMQFGSEPVQIVGYSMGGRLLLNVLSKFPKRFERALILSARPSMPLVEAATREKWELDWVERFKKDEWADLETAWDKYEIFASSPKLERRQSPILREMLGQSLWNLSPRNHAHLQQTVKDLPPSVDWAFGALDQKYLQTAKWLQEEGVQGQIVQIPNAGHRLIVEAVDFVADWLAARK